MYSISAKIDPPGAAQASVEALSKAPFEIKAKVSAEIEDVANQVASAAAGAIRMHPSGLWKGLSSGGYKVAKKTLLSIGVQSLGGAMGKAESMSEFSAIVHAPRGYWMIESFNKTYGRTGGSGEGRVLWAAYDAREDAYVKAVEEIVAKYAESFGGE